jgi:hypothetical protein
MDPGDSSRLKKVHESYLGFLQEIVPKQLIEISVQSKARFAKCQQKDDVITTVRLHYS